MIAQFLRKDVPFRSITDLKDFDDRTIITDPSETDPSQYVPTEILIGRIMRGESYRRPVDREFEIHDGSDNFDAIDITTTDGFDLADATAILQGAAEASQSKPQTPADAPSVNAAGGSGTPLPEASNAFGEGSDADASVAQQGKEAVFKP
nr:MAG: hypothetical protein [Microvirus sp.]